MKLKAIAIALVLAAPSLHAQKVKDEKVSFEFIRQPKMNTGDVDGYQVMYENLYEDRVNAQEAEYQAAYESWQMEKQRIDQEYASALEDYESKSTGKKILESALLEQGKPVRAPYPPQPQKGFIPKIHNTDGFGTTAVQVYGYSTSTGSPIAVTIKLNGFEAGTSEVDKKSYVRKVNGESQTYYKYSMKYQYKHPLSVRIESPDKGVLVDQLIPATDTWTTTSTSEFDSEGALYNYWNTNQNSKWAQADDAVIRHSLEQANIFVNDHVGFTPVTRTIDLYYIKPKKFEYDDVQEAYDLVFTSIKLLSVESKRDEVIANLNQATEILEGVVAEADRDDKKARITGEAEAAMRLNLAEIYIWLREFDKAEDHLNQVRLIDKGRYNRKEEELRTFARDMAERDRAASEG